MTDRLPAGDSGSSPGGICLSPSDRQPCPFTSPHDESTVGHSADACHHDRGGDATQHHHAKRIEPKGVLGVLVSQTLMAEASCLSLVQGGRQRGHRGIPRADAAAAMAE